MKEIIYQSYEHFYERMLAFVKENKEIKECDVCFCGDSLIEMFDLSVFDKPNYVNRGIISDKTAGVLMSLNDRVIAINPKTIFLLIGTNDICDGYSIKSIMSNIENIIELLKENNNNVRIIVSTILPPCYYNAKHVDHIYPDCRDINKIKYLNNEILKLKDVEIFDSYSVLSDKNDSLALDDTIDGVHLTKSAYLKLVDKIKKIL